MLLDCWEGHSLAQLLWLLHQLHCHLYSQLALLRFPSLQWAVILVDGPASEEGRECSTGGGASFIMRLKISNIFRAAVLEAFWSSVNFSALKFSISM